MLNWSSAPIYSAFTLRWGCPDVLWIAPLTPLLVVTAAPATRFGRPVAVLNRAPDSFRVGQPLDTLVVRAHSAAPCVLFAAVDRACRVQCGLSLAVVALALPCAVLTGLAALAFAR